MKTTTDIIKSIEKVYMRYSINKKGLFKYNQPIQSPNLPTNTFFLDLTEPYPPALITPGPGTRQLGIVPTS